MGKSKVSNKKGQSVKVTCDDGIKCASVENSGLTEDRNVKTDPDKRLAIGALSVFLGTSLIFIKTSPPSLVGGDSGECLLLFFFCFILSIS